MNLLSQLLLYSALISIGALGGAFVPLMLPHSSRRVGLLSFAAGIMLGAAFFHMMPEAFHGGGYSSFALVPLGFLVFFLLERYVFVHACEEPPDCLEHGHGQALGLTALVGLCAHTLLDGVALGSAINEGVGLMAMVAIVAHKVPSTLSLAAILRNEGKSFRTVLAQTVILSLMVPVGGAIYFVAQTYVPWKSFASVALAFSAGTFLYISVSDLLPHINRHGPEKRLGNILGMVSGMTLMFLLTFFTKHKHG